MESSLTNGELTLIASAYPAEAIEFAVQATSALTEGGEVDINNEIILDNTFANNQKAKCVFNKLLSLDSNSYFKNMITSMFASSDVSNIKFSIANLPQGFDAVTLPSAPYIFPGKSLYNITLSENFVANASTAEIALVLIHELIHAELLERLLRMGVISNMSYNASYNATFYFSTTNSMANLDQYFINAIITYYRTSIGDNPDQWNHNMMTDLHYVDKITENLLAIYPLLNSSENDFLTNINSDSNNQTGNYTLNEALGYMSWIGLESTNGYINNIESDTIKLNKKNYIESVARTKFTNNCQ